MNRFSRSLCWLGLALVLEGLAVFGYLAYWSRPESGMWSLEHEQMREFVAKQAAFFLHSTAFLCAVGTALVTGGLGTCLMRPTSN